MDRSLVMLIYATVFVALVGLHVHGELAPAGGSPSGAEGMPVNRAVMRRVEQGISSGRLSRKEARFYHHEEDGGHM